MAKCKFCGSEKINDVCEECGLSEVVEEKKEEKKKRGR